MGWGWGESQDAHAQVYGQDGQYDSNVGYDDDNKPKFSHELVAGAGAFEGFKLFEDHQRKEGKPVSHQFAKEALAGLVGVEVDRLAESKGMNEYDKLEAQHKAKQNAMNMYDEHYIQNQGADQYDPDQYGAPSHFQQQRGGNRGGYGGGGYGGGNDGGYGGGNGGGYGGDDRGGYGGRDDGYGGGNGNY